MKNATKLMLILLAVLAATAVLAACSAYVGDPASDFKYEISKGEVTITGYAGNKENVKIFKSLEGKSVTSIGNGAFRGCSSLTSITIPSSVTSIGDRAFYGCSALTSINVDAGNTAYKSVDGVLFTKGGETLVQYPSGKTATSYTIPDSVTNIGSSAFYGCSSLASITIPSSVVSIGQYAFSGCTKQASITIPSSVTTIGSYAFYGCSSLTNVTIGNGVTSIGSGAFSGCTSLASITIGNGVTTIGSYAFQDCTSLTILCRAAGKPSGWNTYWNSSNRHVVWGYTGE